MEQLLILVDPTCIQVDYKMKTAREKLPALVQKNPPRSDTTIFGRADAEVHGLLPEKDAWAQKVFGGERVHP